MDRSLAFISNIWDAYFGVGDFILLVIVLAMCVFWVTQFVQLMMIEDRLFFGRFDKVIWAVVFVVVPLLAPFAFRTWKSARLAVPAPKTTDRTMAYEGR